MITTPSLGGNTQTASSWIYYGFHHIWHELKFHFESEWVFFLFSFIKFSPSTFNLFAPYFQMNMFGFIR